MALKTKIALRTTNNSSFPDSPSSTISPAKLRGFHSDIIDSMIDPYAISVDVDKDTLHRMITLHGEVTVDEGINTNYVLFTTSSIFPLQPGMRRLNTTIGTTEFRMVGHDVTIQDGFEFLGFGYNSSSVEIPNGTPIIEVEGYGEAAIIIPAIASNSGNQNFRVNGITTEPIPPNSYGIYAKGGTIHDLDLSAFQKGDKLYLSQTVSGSMITADQLDIKGRVVYLGKVLDNSATVGILSIDIKSEFGTSQATQLEIDNFSVNNLSTGVFSFGGITKTSNTTFSVSPAQGWVVDNYTDPSLPTVKYIDYPGATGLTTSYLNTATITYLLLDQNSNLVSQSNVPTPIQRRDYIYLGKIGHPDKANLSIAFQVVDSMQSPLSQVRDMFLAIPLINDGVKPYAGPNLNFNATGGTLYGLGINFPINSKDPNRKVITGGNPVTFQYRTQLGGNLSDRTTIDPLNWDNGGVITLVGSPAKQATNQRIYLLQDGSFRIQYGQQVYIDLDTAVNAIPTETFTPFPNFRDNGILIGILSVSSDVTALNNTLQAVFTLTSKFGEAGGGGAGVGGTATLQSAYNNSTEPEIITNPTLGAVTFKRGSTSDTDNVVEIKNGADALVGSVTGEGILKLFTHTNLPTPVLGGLCFTTSSLYIGVD